jgi:hypothetical protein
VLRILHIVSRGEYDLQCGLAFDGFLTISGARLQEVFYDALVFEVPHRADTAKG